MAADLRPPFGASYSAFRTAVADIVRSELAPRLEAWIQADSVPLKEILASLARQGCVGVGFAEHHGGTGGNLWHCVVLHEELARLRCSSIGTTVLSHLEVGTRLVADHASAAAVEQWVPSALQGTTVLGYAATEANAGSDLAATTTMARTNGGCWIINGEKRFITNALEADGLCVLARTGGRGVTSHSLFLVPMAAEGVTVTPLSSLGNQGTLGEVQFEEVRLEADALIGLEGQGLLLQIARLAHERAFVAVILTAMAQVALEAVFARSTRRLPGVRGCASADGNLLAGLIAQVEEARYLAYSAIEALILGRDARTSAAMAKLVASRTLREVTENDLVLRLGSDALDTDGGMTRSFRDALGFLFAGGTETMLLESIAR